MRKFIVIFLFLAFIFAPSAAGARESREFTENQDEVNLYFFHGEGCPHCADEEVFLDKLEAEQPGLNVYRFEVWHNKENQVLIADISREFGFNFTGVPLTIVGTKMITGFASENSHGAEIKKMIEDCRQQNCHNVVAEVIDQGRLEKGLNNEGQKEPIAGAENINAPFFGKLDLSSFSLPLITVIIGALDGFNPCAMWVLLFLISLLLGMENKRRMWLFGIVFIVASAAVYFVFLAAWLNILLFIGYLIYVRYAIAIIALASGIYHLREFWTNKDAGCQTAKDERRRSTFEKLKQITQKKSFWLALGGIVLLAVAVNLVELMCSAGLPAVYTQILTLNDLPVWQYYAYLLLYICIFMLDDIIVFVIAMVTLQMTGISSKYARYASLVGGIVMLIIGILMIFRPEWLTFT